MFRKLFLTLLLVLTLSSVSYSRGKVQGVAEFSQAVTTSGINSSNKFSRILSSAIVTVYCPIGTTTICTIYSDIAGTPQANPFTAGVDGSYSFYTDDPSVDIRFSGVTGVSSFTLGSIPAVTTSLNNNRLAKTASYTLNNVDKGKTIALGGSAFYTLTVAAASTYDIDFMSIVVNEDTVRAKKIAINGLTSFLLYPRQSIILFNQNNVWQLSRQARWQAPASTTVYVNGTLGSDSNDGLATGAGALATIQAAINLIKSDYDLCNVVASPIIVQVADGTYTNTGPVILVNGPFFGYQPSTTIFPSANEVPVLVRGNIVTPANVVLSNTSGGLGTVLSLLGATIGLDGMKITSTGNGLQAGAAAIIFTRLVLGACVDAKIYTTHSAVVESYGDFSIEGNSAYPFFADYNSSILFTTGTITFNTNIVGTAFANSSRASTLDFSAMTISPGAFGFTGRRFVTGSNGTINTGTVSLTYLPGTSAGVNAGFGTYQSTAVLNSDLKVLLSDSNTAAGYLTNAAGAIVQLSNNYTPSGTIDDSGKAAAVLNLVVSNGLSKFEFFTSTTNNVVPTLRVRLDNNGQLVLFGRLVESEGATLTFSTNAITPTDSIHQLGAGLIKTINVPAGFTSGTIAFVPTAAFTYDATGNIIGTGTAVIGRTMFATYSASTSKWTMSY